MKQCIIADFEWCVTPHAAGGSRFMYFNEILSAGAVRIDEKGTILNRFYSLVRPDAPAFLHPVILSSLRLDRGELAESPSFAKVYEALSAFIGNAPVFTWGCADQSALTQNLRIKGGMPRSPLVQQILMRDLQPTLCRGLEIPSPYPSLASVLGQAGIHNDENRHNALSDAEDTSRLWAILAKKNPEPLTALLSRPVQQVRAARTAVAVPKSSSVQKAVSVPSAAAEAATSASLPPTQKAYDSISACLQAARKIRQVCPVCGEPVGIGIWIRDTPSSAVTLCSCTKDGKFLCSMEAQKTPDGMHYTPHPTLFPYTDSHKSRYESARRAERRRRSLISKNK